MAHIKHQQSTTDEGVGCAKYVHEQALDMIRNTMLEEQSVLSKYESQNIGPHSESAWQRNAISPGGKSAEETRIEYLGGL